MLRYFLGVDPPYGAHQVKASVSAKSYTHCGLLGSLGDQLPKAQQSAIEALSDSDPELVVDAVGALGRWGSADAEGALWSRLQRFHDEWTGREGELRMRPDSQSQGSKAATLEQALVNAIASGSGWICSPDKLARIATLIFTQQQREQIERWIKDWNYEYAQITPNWFSEDATFSVLQFNSLTEQQLRAKIAQFPRGMQLRWQFWQPGQTSSTTSMEMQEVIYEKMRAVADEAGVKMEKLNHP